MDYNEYKAPKKNHRWTAVVWGLLVLNCLTLVWNYWTGSWAIWIAAVGILFSFYNIYMHHVRGTDPWN